MNLKEYKICIEENGFVELPENLYYGKQVFLDEILDYNQLELDVKIHICEILIVKCLPPDQGLFLPRNIIWFVQKFLDEFENDLFNSGNTLAIKEAIRLTLSEDYFGKQFVGTVFMYRTIEYYGKAMLGCVDEFGRLAKDKMKVNSFLVKLRKGKSGFSISMNKVNKMNKKKYKFYIAEHLISNYLIEDRYTSKRNSVMHGGKENSTEGIFLASLYMLMHWNKIKDEN